jgi:hypothetical protein
MRLVSWSTLVKLAPRPDCRPRIENQHSIAVAAVHPGREIRVILDRRLPA